jgi:hypothetical protein
MEGDIIMKRLLIALILLGAHCDVSSMQRVVPGDNPGTHSSAMIETAKPFLAGIAGYIAIPTILKIGAFVLSHPIAIAGLGIVALYALGKSNWQPGRPKIPSTNDILEMLKNRPELRSAFFNMMAERQSTGVRDEDEESSGDYDHTPRRRRNYRAKKRRPRRKRRAFALHP